jgi:transposase
LEPTLDNVVVRRPRKIRQHLCADKGYDGQPAEQSMRARRYVPHIRRRGEEIAQKKKNPRHRTRRWVVERTNSWLNRWRKLLVRFEKRADSYEGLLELACALIAFRQCIVIYG